MDTFLSLLQWQRRTLADALAKNIRMASRDTSTAVPFVDLWNDIAHQEMEWIDARA